MKLEIGKIYKFYDSVHWTCRVYNTITNEPLKKDALITLVDIVQKQKRNETQITYIFFHGNKLYWHSFTSPCKHEKDILENKIFEEII